MQQPRSNRFRTEEQHGWKTDTRLLIAIALTLALGGPLFASDADLLQKAKTLTTVGKFEEVIGLCDQIIAASPQDLPARHLRLFAYEAIGESQKAKADCEFILQSDVNDVLAHVTLAELLYHEGRTRESFEALKQCAERTGSPTALAHYGARLAADEKLEESRAAFAASLQKPISERDRKQLILRLCHKSAVNLHRAYHNAKGLDYLKSSVTTLPAMRESYALVTHALDHSQRLPEKGDQRTKWLNEFANPFEFVRTLIKYPQPIKSQAPQSQAEQLAIQKVCRTIVAYVVGYSFADNRDATDTQIKAVCDLLEEMGKSESKMFAPEVSLAIGWAAALAKKLPKEDGWHTNAKREILDKLLTQTHQRILQAERAYMLISREFVGRGIDDKETRLLERDFVNDPAVDAAASAARVAHRTFLSAEAFQQALLPDDKEMAEEIEKARKLFSK